MDNLRAFKKNVWYLIGASRGGPMRVKIVKELMTRPLNSNQLSERLKVDYKTIRHRLEVMQKNNWITSGKEKYGSLYFTAFTEEEKQVFEEIWNKIGKKL